MRAVVLLLLCSLFPWTAATAQPADTAQPVGAGQQAGPLASAVLESEASDARFFPPSTVIYAELLDPGLLVSTIWDHPLRTKIESLPEYAAAKRSPGYQKFQAGRKFLEAHFGMSWREAIDAFAGQGICVAADPAGQAIALLVRGQDADSVRLLRDKWIALSGKSSEVLQKAQYRGVKIYQFEKFLFAIHEDRWLMTNQGDIGRQILERLIDPSADALAQQEQFRSARQSRETGGTLWTFVNIGQLRNSNIARAAFQDPIDNPVAELLAGGIQSVLKETAYASAEISIDSDGAGARVRMPFQSEWVPDEREYYFGPDASGCGPVLPETDEILFTLSTYRNVSEMWLRAGDLFGQATNDGLAKADSNLTTLFAGRDFGQDILGSLEPQLGVIVRRQDFQGVLPRPTIRLPAFALVLQLRQPETMTGEFRRIFQSLVGFLNVVGAMDGRNQLELGMEKLDQGGQLVSSTVVPEVGERESTQAGLIYNFSPSIAYRGQHFVISSTKELARALVTASSKTPRTTDDNTTAALHAEVLARVLDDNREQLIAQNMLEKGNSRQEAEAAIDLVMEVVGYFDGALLRLGAREGQLDLELNVTLDQ